MDTYILVAWYTSIPAVLAETLLPHYDVLALVSKL